MGKIHAYRKKNGTASTRLCGQKRLDSDTTKDNSKVTCGRCIRIIHKQNKEA